MFHTDQSESIIIYYYAGTSKFNPGHIALFYNGRYYSYASLGIKAELHARIARTGAIWVFTGRRAKVKTLIRPPGHTRQAK